VLRARLLDDAASAARIVDRQQAVRTELPGRDLSVVIAERARLG
jgi:hypothetical protein